MMYIVWIGTKDNPKQHAHKPLSEEEADKLIDRLLGLFPDIVTTKEEVK